MCFIIYSNYHNYRGIITRVVEENLRLLCSRKSERGLRRVGDVAREWGNMAKHFTAHKAVVACVSGEDVARIVARMARIVARMARIAKFGYRGFFSLNRV